MDSLSTSEMLEFNMYTEGSYSLQVQLSCSPVGFVEMVVWCQDAPSGNFSVGSGMLGLLQESVLVSNLVCGSSVSYVGAVSGEGDHVRSPPLLLSSQSLPTAAPKINSGTGSLSATL